MKKLIVLSTSLFVFASLGLSANAFAAHQDPKKPPMNKMEKASNEVADTSSDLLNEAGGAANSVVREAADAIHRTGQYINNSFKKVTNKAK
jgi:hypothetical protein